MKKITIEVSEEAIRAKEAEVAVAQQEKARSQRPTEQRLAAYYRMGDIGVLNLLFSASSLPELLKFKEYFHRILQHDREIIAQYRQTFKRRPPSCVAAARSRTGCCRGYRCRCPPP